jgi:hypothetical protein
MENHWPKEVLATRNQGSAGRALTRLLEHSGYRAVALDRHPAKSLREKSATKVVRDISSKADAKRAFAPRHIGGTLSSWSEPYRFFQSKTWQQRKLFTSMG